MLTEMLRKNLDIVFFIYGFSFFIMGSAIFFQPRKKSEFKLVEIIWLLALFGLTHSMNEFLDMWALIKGGHSLLSVCRLEMLITSFIFLFEFGRRLLRFRVLGRWSIIVITLAILGKAIFFPVFWFSEATMARYFIGFPATIFSSLGFFVYYRLNREKLDKINVKKYFVTVSASFLLYGICSGLVVPQEIYFPANWVNEESFLKFVHIPVQIFRAFFATAIAWAMCGMLRIFNYEREEKLQIEVLERTRANLIRDGLRSVVEVSDHLIVSVDQDSFFKLAVEFSREKLGFERCAIFIQDNDYMVGTYGTDRYGRTTDERNQRFPKDQSWDERCRMMGPQDPKWFVVDEPYLEWTGQYPQQIGKGWIAVTPIRSASRTVGVFVNDTAISVAPIDPLKQDILAVFSSFLGNIFERNSMERELLVMNKRFEKLVIRDSHTGLYNHRYLMNIIEVEFERATRLENPFSIIMFDLDYFKSINDVYGHQFGDLVLKQLARQMKKAVRKYDVVTRFGGEEFIIVAPGTDRLNAVNLASRMLEQINVYDFGNAERTVKIKVTISVSSFPEDKVLESVELIELADRILRKAKEDGGNRVYSSGDLKKINTSVTFEANGTSEVDDLKMKIEKLTKRANQSLIEAVFAFAKTMDYKDHETAKHSEITVRYATEIAEALGLVREDVELIKQACILHDLGKIGISEQILSKKSKLTVEEFEEIKKHPQIGVDIIRPIYFLHNIIPIMLYHHEKWDGTGYPKGLKGDKIPIGARIVAVADVFQALTSERPYRQAYSQQEAINIIKEGSGTQFDPMIVELFLQLLERDAKAS
jgi:diguanylate cyclase (GGDEF)-like protein/putative nucleotidyltransferase with HDIG domain